MSSEATAPVTSIVLVEDHTMVAEAFTSAFDREPDLSVVGLATSVAEAVRVVGRTNPDLAVIDFRLPDGDGADAVLRVRQRCPGVRTLIVTSATDDRSLTRSLGVDADGYLLKDQPLEELLDGVRTVAAGGTAYAPALLVRLLQRSGRTSTSDVPQLSDREAEVLHLLACGRSTTEMADDMHLSVNTVRNHVQGVITKLETHSRIEAVAVGVREGLIAPPTGAPPRSRTTRPNVPAGGATTAG